jgi:hypothetical protein
MDIAPGKPVPLHDEYRRGALARDFWRRSDRCRSDYAAGNDANARPILPRHPRETDTRHLDRIGAAIGRPFVRAIISRYNDFTCREPATRPDAVGAYGEVYTDATGTGVDLPTLMRRTLRQAQVAGVAYLLCDATDAGGYLSAAEEQAAGRRGVLQPIDPDQVLNWTDWRGELVEALIALRDPAGAPYLWHVTPTTVQRIEVDDQGTPDPGRWKVTGQASEPMPHTAGGCPLVRLRPLGDDPHAGSQAEPIAESQKRICYLDSLLLEELAGITFTATVLLGVDAATIPANAFTAPGGLVCLPPNNGTVPSVAKISADTAQAESLRKSLDRELSELYRVAGLAAGNPTQVGQPESGVARAFAFNEVEALLSGLADAAERCENIAVRRLSGMHGWPYPGDANWPDSFTVADFATDLEQVIRLETGGAPDVLVDQSWRDFAGAHYSLTPEQTAELDEELTEDADNSREGPAAQLDRMTSPAARKGGTSPADAGKDDDDAEAS